MEKATSLQAKIVSINTLYTHSIKVIEHEINFLSGLVGKNILKVDGSFKQKYEHERLVIEDNVTEYGYKFFRNTRYWFTADYGKLTINVRTCVSGGGADRNGVNAHCNYETQSFDLFTIKDGALIELITADRSYLAQPFDEVTILQAAAKVKEVAAQFEKVLDSVP